MQDALYILSIKAGFNWAVKRRLLTRNPHSGVTAKDWRDDIGAPVCNRDGGRRADEHRHKTAAKKDRVIYFTGEALALVRDLVRGKRPDD